MIVGDHRQAPAVGAKILGGRVVNGRSARASHNGLASSPAEFDRNGRGRFFPRPRAGAEVRGLEGAEAISPRRGGAFVLSGGARRSRAAFRAAPIEEGTVTEHHGFRISVERTAFRPLNCAVDRQ